MEFYQDPRGRRPVEQWILELQVADQTRIRRAFALLEIYDTQLTMPHARHLRGKLWELRVAAGRSDYRVCYAAVLGRRFILLQGFGKKTSKTPSREIDLAERRLVDFQAREGQKG